MSSGPGTLVLLDPSPLTFDESRRLDSLLETTRGPRTIIVASDDVADLFSGVQPLPSLRLCDEFAAAWLSRWLTAVRALPQGRDLALFRGLDLWDTAESSFRLRLYRPIGFVWRALHALRDVDRVIILTSESGPGLMGRTFALVARERGIPCETKRSRSSGVSRATLARMTKVFARHARRRWQEVTGTGSRGAERDFAGRSTRVLFAEFYGPNVGALRQIRDALAEGSDAETGWLGMRRQVTDAARVIGDPVFDLDGVFEPGDSHALLAHHRKFEARLDTLLSEAGTLRLFDVEGICARDVLSSELKAALGQFTHAAARFAVGLDRALDRIRPHVVVTANDTSLPGRVLAQVCRARALPLVYVQHGVSPSDPYAMPPVADLALLWGERTARVMTALGVQPDRIVQTGAARYDAFFRAGTAGAGNRFPTRSTPMVLFTGQPLDRGMPRSVYRQTLAAFLSASRVMSGMRFVLKPHPREDPALLAETLHTCPPSPVEVVHLGDTYELLKDASVVVTQYSTTGVEAVLLDKPLIALNVSDEPERVPYVEAGVAVSVRSADALPGAILAALECEPTRASLAACRKTFVQEMFALRDGTSARVCADAVVAAAGSRATREHDAAKVLGDT